MITALCCFYEAYPPASGAAAVTFNVAKFLPGKTLLIQVGSSEGTIELKSIRVVTVPAASEGKFRKIASLRPCIKSTVNHLSGFQPDFVILEGASWAVYHLMLLKAIRKAVPSTRIIYHSHNVEYLLRLYRNGRAIAALTRWAEGRLLRCADLSTAVSTTDQAHFARLYGVRPILLPNGVDFERFAGVRPEAVARMRAKYGLNAQTALFSGFYAYPPNREAVDFLVKSVMPGVRERYPSAALALTGGGAPYRDSWIRNVGSVPYEDFAAFVAACGIAVAPIFSGSGTRLKILEAMAAGLPVVATEKAAEGLGLRHREHALFASSSLEFANAIGELLENRESAEGLVRSARQRVKAEFSWQAIAANFEREMEHVSE
jgi:glycosyltransferase involved in cell wall biosynthesis